MAANIGGRLMGTSFAWVTTYLAAQAWMPGEAGKPSKIALTASMVVSGLCVVACALLAFLPEPPPEEISDEAAAASS
jgi:hypothetical protein